MRRRRWRQRSRCLAAAAPAPAPAGATAAGTALRLRGGVKGDGEGRVGVEDEDVMTTGRLCGVDGSAWRGLDGMWMRSDEGSRTGGGGASVAAASGEAAAAMGMWWWWCIYSKWAVGSRFGKLRWWPADERDMSDAEMGWAGKGKRKRVEAADRDPCPVLYSVISATCRRPNCRGRIAEELSLEAYVSVAQLQRILL
jgi:hypothetical protein